MTRLTALLLIGVISVDAQTTFTDVTEQAGIQHQYKVYEGLFGGGVCVFDFNNDGLEDLYLPGGMNGDQLYRNDGDGRFTNVYRGSGLEPTSLFMTQGAASADVNRDGWRDLFITTITRKDSTMIIPRAHNLFFINNGDGTFRDATLEYGFSDLVSFSTGASFSDFNADGYPDLYVADYFNDYDGKVGKMDDATVVNANLVSKGHLYINRKGERFEDVYRDFDLDHKGFGFGGVFTDYDNDSDVDLLINHDFGYKAPPNVFLRNEYPRRSFTDVGKDLHMDLKVNAMGTAVGDYDNNGWMDYYITNIKFNQLMTNKGEGNGFVSGSKERGLDFISISWGANFADFDHDTDLDLFVANGDLNPNDVPLANFYFENEGARFLNRGHEVGLNDYGIGRGSVVFDMDNDGDLDILVVNQAPVLDYPVPSTTRLFRNDSRTGNWLKIVLKGVDADLNGIGSRVEVIAGGIKMIREIDGGSSHLSQNAAIAHVGLGDIVTVDSIIVKWLGGNTQLLTNQSVNTLIIIEEKPRDGWKARSFVVAGVSLGMIFALVFFSIRSRRKRFNSDL